jgi:hypothetical protein
MGLTTITPGFVHSPASGCKSLVLMLLVAVILVAAGLVPPRPAPAAPPAGTAPVADVDGRGEGQH